MVACRLPVAAMLIQLVAQLDAPGAVVRRAGDGNIVVVGLIAAGYMAEICRFSTLIFS